MITIGFLDIFKKNNELAFMYDFDLLEDQSEKVHMKRLAIQTCINMIGRTISQSEFRTNKNGEAVKDELYYRFNVRPNPNMSASTFWQTVIYKLIYDNECLIIKTDTNDLVIADDFYRKEYAMVEDMFKNVVVKDFTFKRTFTMSEVIYLEYNNDKLIPLIDGLFNDYGDLFSRMVDSHKRKNQTRATVDIDASYAKSKEDLEKVQKFIDTTYKAISDKPVVIIPQQKGYTYQEHSKGQQAGQSVDEINKVTDGFLNHIAKALGIPASLLHGDMADVEKQTRNYMTFCIDPLLKSIGDEFNAKFFTKKEYLNGERVDIKRISYSNLFDLAASIDKLVSSGAFTPNELRGEVGYEQVDDEKLNQFHMTKNYTGIGEDNSLEGGDDKNDETI